MTAVIKSLIVNPVELTKVKRRLLSETRQTYSQMVLECLDILLIGKGHTRTSLHQETYKDFRERFRVPSQLVISARVYAWGFRRNYRKHKSDIKRISVSFDNRLFSLSETKSGNPVFSLRTIRKRVGIPIAVDGAYRRLQQHLEEGWSITSVKMTSTHKFVVLIKKEFESKPMPNVLGVDVNSGNIAVTVKNPRTGRIIKQLYFAQDIAYRQIRFEQRRSTIQEHRDNTDPQRSGKKLKNLSGRQRNFVTTRLHQVVNEIIRLAEANYASIAIEDLKDLRKSKTEWTKRSRKIVNRIPYGQFRFLMEYKTAIKTIPLVAVKPKYTSQMCPKCGHTTKNNWVGYHYFRCEKCGFEANRDRVASVNICDRASATAVTSKSTLFSDAEAVVNQLVRPCETTCS